MYTNQKFNIIYIFLSIAVATPSFSYSQCVHGDVRLVGGSNDREGNVQVCINSIWGYVCDWLWDTNDAEVVCTQLGYSVSSGSYAVYFRDSYYGYGNGTIWLDGVQCKGPEDNILTNCSTYREVGNTHCGYDDMAGVACAYGNHSCIHEGEIRLVAGYDRSEGRVEICYSGTWGTVCGNSWGSNEAMVVCKQLGYSGYFSYTAKYGMGTGSIWLNGLACNGNESNLLSCPSTDPSGCSHLQDVGVRCYGVKSSCINGSVTLWSAYNTTPDNEGIVLVCWNGIWYPLHSSSNCRAAQIACNASGYSKLEYRRSDGDRYYGLYYNEKRYHYVCSENSTSLSNCTEAVYPYWYYNSLAVRCQPGLMCTNDDIRLVGGDTDSEGRVEYCYNEEWAPLCSLSNYAASFICQKLGYTKWSRVVALDTIFGRTDAVSEFQYFSCSASHNNISDCTAYTKSTCNEPTCRRQYGLKCYASNQCNDGDVRLLDGIIEQEGRPEVCVDGVWGSICDASWSISDSYVMCLSLGYSGSANPIRYTRSTFGAGSGPIVWSSVNCYYWNTDIFDCLKNLYPYHSCTIDEIAGIGCTEGCSDGDIRLVGSDRDDAGTVEICYNELWGLISDSEWGSDEGKVVCKQLGYSSVQVSKSFTGSHYGKPNKTIHLRSIDCSGQETTLADCSLDELSFSEGRLFLANASVAGVDCRSVLIPAAVGGSIGSVLGLLLVAVVIIITIVLIIRIRKQRSLKQKPQNKLVLNTPSANNYNMTEIVDENYEQMDPEKSKSDRYTVATN